VTAAAIAAVVVAAAVVAVEVVTVAADAASIRRTVLESGVRVLTESMPEALSVASGFWFTVGGRDEPPPLSGASHFLEHLVFKGTDHLSAREIAESVDALGGDMNAFTSREHTAYYTRLPASALEFGLQLLRDVLAAPALRPHEIDAEREVILDELAQSEDTPEDKVHSALAALLFPDHPLGREVLGDRETIDGMHREDIDSFFGDHYRPANVVISVAGRLDHDDVVATVASFLDGLEPGTAPERSAPVVAQGRLAVVHKPTEQAHIALGWRAPGQGDPDRFALSIANQILGGGLASRLFQEIREERGLAYSVYSGLSLYSDIGAAVVYAGTSPGRAHEVLDLIREQVAAIARDGVTEKELAVAAGGLEGGLLLSLEDSSSRMSRLARGELSPARALSVDEQVAAIRAVTLDDVARSCARVFSDDHSLAVVGPFERDSFA
jgi:predicted Zn-dependent peptidase